MFYVKESLVCSIKSSIQFMNLITPELFLQYTKDILPNIWNKHVIRKDIEQNEMLYTYPRIFDPEFDQEDYALQAENSCFQWQDYI
jgi:hypothetical protein